MLFFYSSILAPALEATLTPGSARPPAAGRSREDALIPRSIGSVTASRDFKSAVTVITIQDLHSHPEVQYNISRIIASLDQQYGLANVYVEGACGDVDTSWLEGIPDALLKKNIAGSLVNAGRLTGGEYYSITAGKPRLLKGLEDEQLHTENIVRLGKILGRKKQFEAAAARLDDDMALLKARYLTHKNNKLNTLIQDYKSRKITARKYYTILRKYVDQVNARPDQYNELFTIRMARYPNTVAYLDLLDIEQHLRYPRITGQLQSFMQDLKATLPFSAYNALLTQTDNCSATDKLYVLLAGIARERNIDLARRYPDLGRFFAYLDKGKSVNPVQLIQEEKRLIEELRIAYSRDVSEVEASFLADFYDTFKDYLCNKLSANDYGYFVSRFDKFKTIWAKYTYANHLKELESSFPLLDAYYRVNNERSERFVENILKNKTASVIVMVTGGFHSEEVQKLLEERKISYRTITPNIVTDADGSNAVYQEIVTEQAAVFSRHALSYRLFTQMAPQLLPKDNGFFLTFNTGEIIEVTKDGQTKSVTMKAHPEMAGIPPASGWIDLSLAARAGAAQALESAAGQFGAMKTLLTGIDLVPFTGMMYFLARKGWVDGEGLTFDAAHSGPEATEDMLLFLARAIEARAADENQLAQLPGFVQQAVLRHVQSKRALERGENKIPDYIKAVEGLYEVLIRINNLMDNDGRSQPIAGSEVILDRDGRIESVAPQSGNEDIDHVLFALFGQLIERRVEHVVGSFQPNLEAAYQHIKTSMQANVAAGRGLVDGIEDIVMSEIYPDDSAQLDFVRGILNDSIHPLMARDVDPSLRHVRVLASGTYGAILLVRDTRDDRLKILKVAKTAPALIIMWREIDTLKHLTGIPRLVTIEKVYEESAAILMEYVAGYTLDEYRRRGFGPAPASVRAALFQFADQVTARGCRLKDFHPGNVMYDPADDRTTFIDVSVDKMADGYDPNTLADDNRYEVHETLLNWQKMPSSSPEDSRSFADEDGFSALSLHFTRFLRAAGIGLDVPSAELAAAIIQRFTGEARQNIIPGRSRKAVAIEKKIAAYLKETAYLHPAEAAADVRVVVTNGRDNFVKSGNTICGMPSLLHREDDGSLTLYIHEGFLDALYAENSILAEELRAGLPRGSLIEKFVREEVDELFAVHNLIATQKLSLAEAYERYHTGSPNNRPAHHPLIMTLAEQEAIRQAGLTQTFVPTTPKPDIFLPGDNDSRRTTLLFDDRFFQDVPAQEAVSLFAELMGYDRFVFVDADSLAGPARSAGFEIVDAVLRKSRRATIPARQIRVAKGLSFVQLAGLVSVLYQNMLSANDHASEAYKRVLSGTLNDIDRVVKQFIYAAEYLEHVRADWPRTLELTPEQARPFDEEIAFLIAQFRRVTAGYTIKATDSVQRRQALAESFLEIDEGWLSAFMAQVPVGARVDALAQRLRASRARRAEKIAYELAAPARELYAAVMEQGGLLLDTIQSKTDPLKTLDQQIDEDMAGYAPGTKEYAERLIESVQRRVNHYFDRELYSEEEGSYSERQADVAHAHGVTPFTGVFHNAISIPTVLESKHMLCVMQSYLCGRMLQKRGVSVFWLHVTETVGGRRAGHAALLAGVPGGLYNIVDAIYPNGAGYASSISLAPGEIEQGLSRSTAITKTLDTQRSSRHHRIVITRFAPGAQSDFLTTAGWIALQKGRHEQALELFRRAIEFSPGYFLPWSMLGRLYAEKLKFAAAKQAWEKALELNPEYTVAERRLQILQSLVFPSILPENAGEFLQKLANGVPRWRALLTAVALPEQWRIMFQPRLFDELHGAPNAARTRFIMRAFWTSWGGVTIGGIAGLATWLALGQTGLGVGVFIAGSAAGIATSIAMHVQYDSNTALPGQLRGKEAKDEFKYNEDGKYDGVIPYTKNEAIDYFLFRFFNEIAIFPALRKGDAEGAYAEIKAQLLANASSGRDMFFGIEELLLNNALFADKGIGYVQKLINEAKSDIYPYKVNDVDDQLRYERIIGLGSTGVAILVTDMRDGVRKVLKVPRSLGFNFKGMQPAINSTIDDEIITLKALGGISGLVKVYGFYRERHAILMEYIPGHTLDKYGKALSNSSLQALQEYARKVAQKGYRINDFHGANVMVDDNGTITIIDVAHYSSDAELAIDDLIAFNFGKVEAMLKELRRQGGDNTALPAILPQNAGAYVRTVARLTRFMPARWANVIGLAIVHVKEYSEIMPKEQTDPLAFDKAHGRPNTARRGAILEMQEAASGAAKAVRENLFFELKWLEGLAALIASGIVHIKYDLHAGLPMAFLISESGAGIDNALENALQNGYVPVRVQRLPQKLAGKPPRSAGIKGVWVRLEDARRRSQGIERSVKVLTMYIDAPDSEAFAGAASEAVSSMRGMVGGVRGASRPMRILAGESGKTLDYHAMLVYDETNKKTPLFPAGQDVPVLRGDDQWSDWETMSDVHSAEQVARSPEIGIELSWSPELRSALKNLTAFNQSLFFSMDELNAMNAEDRALIQLLRSKGAKVYAMCHTAYANANVILGNFDLEGIVFTNPLADPQAAENPDVVVAGGKNAARKYVSIRISDPQFLNNLKSVKPGSVVKVYMGKNPAIEDIMALNTLPSSTILLFDGHDIKENSVRRDLTEFSIGGVNMFDILRLVPKNQREKEEYQQKVAYALTIGTFEDYHDAAALEKAVGDMASGNFDEITRNVAFIKAVRLHWLSVADKQMKKVFLRAVAERMRARQALAAAGKTGDLEDPRLERILAEMIAKQKAHVPDGDVLKRFSAMVAAGVSADDMRTSVFQEIMRHKRPADSNGDSQAISTIIALITLYAGETVIADVTEETMGMMRTEAARAILEAA